MSIVRRLARKYKVKASVSQLEYPTTLELFENPEDSSLEEISVEVVVPVNAYSGSKGSRNSMGVPEEPDSPEELLLEDSITFGEDFDFMGKKYKQGDEVPEDILKYADNAPDTMDEWVDVLKEEVYKYDFDFDFI